MTLEEWILLELFLISKYPEDLVESDVGPLMDIIDTWTACAGTHLDEATCPVTRFNIFTRTINISYVNVNYPGDNCGMRRVIV